MLLSLILLIPNLVAADYLQSPWLLDFNPAPTAHRVAIVGGGAAGASAAYHLRQFASDSQSWISVNITLFESSPRIGGRTTTVNAFDDQSFSVELGGSIFVKANPILYNASRDFDLDTRAFEPKDSVSKYDLGVWDGSKFVFKQTSSDSRWLGYWDGVKLLWKYGFSPVKLQRSTKGMISKFLQLYDYPTFPFRSLKEAAEELDMMHLVSVTGEELVHEKGISDTFANDILQAATRVNYAQNLDQIHGLETLVSMAAEGAMSVEGGNWQIFDEMVRRSGAELNLNSTVTAITKDNATDSYTLKVESAAPDRENLSAYDTIIMATPYQFSGIEVKPKLCSLPNAIDYVSLHVTLLASPHQLAPEFFGLSDPSEVPSSVITTLPFRSLNEHDPNDFFSISTLRTIPPGYHSPKQQYLYKIFSPRPLKASFIGKLYGFDFYPESSQAGIGDVDNEHISWYHHKLWHSYPYEVPRTDFEKLKIDGEEYSAAGVWYTSGIESFISTMETSAMMGRNIARLIVDHLEDNAFDESQAMAECGFCRVNPCRCGANPEYYRPWCVGRRKLQKEREGFLGQLTWKMGGFWCMISSLAAGEPSLCSDY